MFRKKIVCFTLVTFALFGCGEIPAEEVVQTPPDMDAANALVADLTPFVEWEPGSHEPWFDEDAARAAGLSEDRIAVGVEMTLLSQDAAAMLSMDEDPTIQKDAAINIAFPWISPLTAVTFHAFRSSLGDACPSPKFAPAITGWQSRATAISKLTNAGYRPTLYPTGTCAVNGPASYGQTGNDYTRPVYASVSGSASVPCYRNQGIVSATPPWTFQVEGGASNSTNGIREPSPEVCEYTWPTWWWGGYTLYYHRFYC